MDIPAVLNVIRQNTLWTLDGDEYAGLTWLDDSPMPSQSELDAAWPQVQYDRAYAEVEAARQAAYQQDADPLFFQWQRGDGTEQAWLDAVALVKATHPYPVAP
jgi:endo-1,4-beta-mannosidase